jgi:hypothetical protein
MFFSWLNTNATALGIIGTVIAAVVQARQYVLVRKSEDRRHTFDAYHKLIDELVGSQEKNPALDRQIAIVYEIRNFKDYYPVTVRILEGLKITWSGNQSVERIIKEIDMTINFIKKNFPDAEKS